MKPAAVVALLTVCLGCTHYVKPGNAPDVPLEKVGQFDKKLSVHLVNDQPDKDQKLFFGQRGHKFYADLNEWTQFAIRELTSALEARGARVSESSPNKIKVKLHDLRGDSGFSTIQVHTKLSVAATDGTWSKVYEETGSSGWSLGRALGGMVYLFVEKLLTDREFLNRLK